MLGGPPGPPPPKFSQSLFPAGPAPPPKELSRAIPLDYVSFMESSTPPAAPCTLALSVLYILAEELDEPRPPLLALEF